jgi:hypothetical protein
VLGRRWEAPGIQGVLLTSAITVNLLLRNNKGVIFVTPFRPQFRDSIKHWQ